VTRRAAAAAGDRRRIVAAGQHSDAMCGWLGRRMAWRRCVDATRVSNDIGEAAAAMSYGSDGKRLLAGRAAAWRARGRPAGGAKAVGELGCDAWSRRKPWAARHKGLQRRCRAAEEEAEEEEEGGGAGG
jgi:hypothetical protein